VVKEEFDSGKKSLVQGPDSGLLKYSNNLCAKCNNERSQPYDRAYDLFASYIRHNFGKLKRTLVLNTTSVFGKHQAKSKQQELFLYFMKAFGCQLHDKGFPVPQELRDALLGSSYPKTFRVSIALNDEFLEFLQNFPFEGSRDQSGAPVDFFWAQFMPTIGQFHWSLAKSGLESRSGFEWANGSHPIMPNLATIAVLSSCLLE
jgi:hypothetical protein